MGGWGRLVLAEGGCAGHSSDTGEQLATSHRVRTVLTSESATHLTGGDPGVGGAAGGVSLRWVGAGQEAEQLRRDCECGCEQAQHREVGQRLYPSLVPGDL